MKEITDLQIGTWNVQSLFRTEALTISLSCLERYKMDITAIQEVRWRSSGSLKSKGILQRWGQTRTWIRVYY